MTSARSRQAARGAGGSLFFVQKLIAEFLDTVARQMPDPLLAYLRTVKGDVDSSVPHINGLDAVQVPDKSPEGEGTLRAELLSIDGVNGVTVRPMPGRPSMQKADCQVDARDGIEARIARAVSARWELHRLERQQATLENVFLRYVREGAPDRREAA